MKNETQAFRLAKMMQKHQHLVSYELLLPPFMLETKACEKLAVNTLLVLGLEALALQLLKEGVVCANVSLEGRNDGFKLRIDELLEEPIKPSDSKKHEILKLSFGFVEAKILTKNSILDTKEINFNKVSLICKEKKRAEATLVLLDNKIALKIEKVEK